MYSATQSDQAAGDQMMICIGCWETYQAVSYFSLQWWRN